MGLRFEPVVEALNRAGARFDFDNARDRRAELELEGMRAPVLGIDDLIRLKRQAGRPRDLEDAGALESLRPGGDDG